MRRKGLLSLLMLIFLTLLVGAVVTINYLRPRVLVLHSYDPDYVWTREVNQGLERAFHQQSRIDIRYHYMNTKTFSGKDDLRRARSAALQAVRELRPNVLIAIDDDAQRLVAKEFVGEPDIQIVFAGINGKIEPYGYAGASNATGILERKPTAAIREMVLLLARLASPAADGIAALAGGQSVTPRALFLGDTSHSVQIDAEHLASFDWAPVDYRGGVFVESFQEWQQQVLNSKASTDFLLVGGYRKLKLADGKGLAKAEEVMSWTEAHSPVPVIGMNVFNTAEGAMLSVGVSGYEQGEVAAKMALELLQNKSPAATLPVQISQQYILALRRSALERRQIRLPKVFEAFSRSTNNFYE